MELHLSENIRACRKERRLTQEQLAEVLGVTAGAVYKWESGISVPELELIVEMADFFDTSVDALLGYRMKDNRLSATVERLNTCCRRLDPAALREAEAALKKYPHSFEIVYVCAEVYLIFAVGEHDKVKARRALELLEKSLLLLPQNTDPSLGEHLIFGNMAEAYGLLGNWDKGIELLKQHNVGGIFNDSIGAILSIYLDRPQEAEPFLSDALLSNLAALMNTVGGYVFVFSARGDFASAGGIAQWGLDQFTGLKKPEAPDFLDKAMALLRILLAHSLLNCGKPEEARRELTEAAGLVRRFDADPDYGIGTIRFAAAPGDTNLHDGLGSTAVESAETLIRQLKNEALGTLWEECKPYV